MRRGSELHPLPEGLTGMIPTNLDALADSALLTPAGRERLAAEVEVPAAVGDADESIASFVSRRLGREAYENLVEPLMTGIYGGDGEQLSLQRDLSAAARAGARARKRVARAGGAVAGAGRVSAVRVARIRDGHARAGAR